jgi:hypothetical protein
LGIIDTFSKIERFFRTKSMVTVLSFCDYEMNEEMDARLFYISLALLSYRTVKNSS